jgi:hypothetical protein
VTVRLERAKVVLFMRVVGVTKVVEHCDCLDETLDSLLAEGGNARGDDSVAANQMLPKFIIESADAVGLGRHWWSPDGVEKIAADLASSRRDEGSAARGFVVGQLPSCGSGPAQGGRSCSTSHQVPSWSAEG